MIKNNIIISVVALFFIACFYFDLSPKLADIRQAQSEEKRWHEKFIEACADIQRGPSVSTDLNHLQKKLSRYFRAGSDQIVMAELLAVVVSAAKMNGVVLLSIQPEKGEAASKLRKLSINIATQSTFIQFAEFISALPNASLPILSQDFILQVEADGKVRVEMKLAGHYLPVKTQDFLPMNPEHLIVKNGIKSNARDPFKLLPKNVAVLTPQDQDNDIFLNSVPFHNIKLVGYIKQNHKLWPLIMLPNGKTLEIQPGAVLGSERARVMTCSDHDVTVEIDGRKVHLKYAI